MKSTEFQHFTAFLAGIFFLNGGDVTLRRRRESGVMKTLKSAFPQPEPALEKCKIPVDNREFSTFSTDFSTGVFHSLLGLWKKCGIDIKEGDTLRQNPHFFLGRKFHHRAFVCAKNQDLTTSGETAGIGRPRQIPNPGPEIFLKKGVDFGGEERYNV